jgi:hypothetical protein
MSAKQEQEVERYFYRSVATSSRHRHRVSVYFVERYQNSNVVARFEAIGLVRTLLGDQELARQRMRRQLVVAGSWQPTASHHHARMKLAPAPRVCE